MSTAALARRTARTDHARVAVWITHTTEGIGLRQELAGAGSRMLAALIDLVLLVATLLAALLVLALATSLDPFGAGEFVLGLLLGGWLLLLVAYFTLFELLWQGQTPGKRVLGIAVRNLDGGPASALQLVLRNVFLPVDLFLDLPLPIGFVLIAALPLAQRLGDLAAGTLVVHLARGGRTREPEPWPDERWSRLERRVLPLTPALAARFTRADQAFLRRLLARAEPVTSTELEFQARRRLYVESARRFAARVGVERFEDARVVLRELYLFLREMRSGEPERAQRTRSSGR